MNFKHVSLAGVFVALFAGAAQAHPHVWVSIETEIQHDANGRMAAMRNRWTFDEMFSAYAVLGLDTNKDGAYDRQELSELAKVNVTSLKEFDYFTFIQDGSGHVTLKDATDYWLEYVDSKLVLNFTLPLATPYETRGKKTVLSIYDPTNFVAFAYGGEDAVRLGGTIPERCSVKMPAPAPQVSAMNLAAAREAQAAIEESAAAAASPADERDVVIDCKAS